MGVERHLPDMKALEAIDTVGTAQLLARAQIGERAAFTELVEQYHAELVRIAYAITGDLDAARDSAQLAWIKAWQGRSGVREPARLRAWLIAIAANEAREYLRARRRRLVREIAPRGKKNSPGRARRRRLIGSISPVRWSGSNRRIAGCSRCATSAA
jgi:hypothetical protein